MENKETVLVTGGSGFIASHCIIQLAAAGYKIKATVHRVIGYGEERYSIPFFFEPSID